MRLNYLKKELKKQKIDLAIVMNSSLKDPNMFYLAGIKPDFALLLLSSKFSSKVYCSTLECAQLKKKSRIKSFYDYNKQTFEKITNLIKKHRIKKIGLNYSFITANELRNLRRLLRKYRSGSDNFDCVVPVSGGKDGSYIAYQLKHKYDMHPLTITVSPPLSLKIGDENLKNFINSGFDHIHINPNVNIMKEINKLGFIEKGFPYYGWLIAVQSAVIRTALNFNIPLIFYGEDGEVEYGGSTKSKNDSLMSIDYQKEIWFEGGYDSVIDKIDIKDNSDLYFWKFPSNKEIVDKGISSQNSTHITSSIWRFQFLFIFLINMIK